MTNGSAPQDVVKRSVTRDDHPANINAGAAIINFLLPAYGYPGAGDLPPYWSKQRDFVLSSTVYRESLWASAIGIAITKKASQSWEVSGDVPLQKKRAQELLHTVDGGQGWVAFLSKHLRDFLCTDNGAFVEVVRATQGAGSRILGLMHLDSKRCTRTGDMDVPVIYRDKRGRLHEMKTHQVIMLADMPNPEEMYFGVGLCAASRAYGKIALLSGLETYVLEKITGRRSLALYFLNGINEKQLSSAITTAEAEQSQKGAVAYMGAIVVPNMGDDPPGMIKIDLAGLPDGFDAKQERDEASLVYADAIGLDWQDIRPLTGQALGTGAQSQVLDDKEQGKGLAAWDQQFTHVVNQWLLSDKVTFAFTENDYRDQIQQAEIKQLQGTTADGHVAAGVLRADQAIRVLIEQDALPKWLQDELEQASADTTLSDAEQPEVQTPEAGALPPEPRLPPGPAQVALKEPSDAAALIAEEFDAARTLAADATRV